ncbi:uncharacterized protein LOC120331448 [Styela clava]
MFKNKNGPLDIIRYLIFGLLSAVSTKAMNHHASSNPCLEYNMAENLILSSGSGTVESSMIAFMAPGCRLQLPHNYSLNTHALLIKVEKMQIKGYCVECETDYCRRDITILGQNICHSEPDTCFIFQSKSTTENRITKSEELDNCVTQHRIIGNFKEFPEFDFGRARGRTTSTTKYFKLQYTFMEFEKPRTTIQPTTVRSNQSSTTSLTLLEIILTASLGTAIITLVIVLSIWCRQAQTDREQSQPANTSQNEDQLTVNTTDTRFVQIEGVYSTPLDAYSTLAKHVVNPAYDTLVI